MGPQSRAGRETEESWLSVDLICRSCAGPIREFRELVLPEGIYRELWVRGLERAWHHCRVLPDMVEEIAKTPHLVPPAGRTGTGSGEEREIPGQEMEAT